jgi:hypothetical protein
MECNWNWLRERQLTYTGMLLGTHIKTSGLGLDVGKIGSGGVGVLQCMLCKFIQEVKAFSPMEETEDPIVRDKS